jgi:hypothetical protein
VTLRPGPATPWRDQLWSLPYQLGMLLAVLYESRGQGEHHPVDPYMNVQDAFEGAECCECAACQGRRS